MASAQDKKRQLHNRDLALRLVKNNIAIFPSLDKTPLPVAWQRLDTSMGEDDKQGEIAAWRKRKNHDDDKEPVYVGCTKSPDVVRQLWKEYPDAVPSISLGPSGLLVIDMDIRENLDGVKLASDELAKRQIDTTLCPTTITRSGARHVFFKNDKAIGNSKLGDLCTDIKGVGGQVVAPGAWREDDKRYTASPDHPSLLEAFVGNDLPSISNTLESFISENKSKKTAITDDDSVDLVETLRSEDWPDANDLIDSTIGKFDVDRLIKIDEQFKQAWSGELDDHSTAMFHVINSFRREYGSDFSILDAAAILQHDDCRAVVACTDDQPKSNPGEYSFRDIARAYAKACDKYKDATQKIATGESFSTVDEDDGEAPVDIQNARVLKKLERDAKNRPSVILDKDAVLSWKPQQWFLHHTIPAAPVGIAFGAPDEYKSFVLIDILSHIVRGRPWREKRVEHVGAIYWFGEGQDGIAGRFKAWALANDTDGGHVGLSDTEINFFAMEKKPLFLAIKKMLDDYAAAAGQICKLLVVDTMSKACMGMDESSPSEAAQALRKAEIIAKALGITILFVAHTGKDKTKGVRGASVFEGNVDFRLRFEGKKLIVDRVKDGKKPEPVAYSVQEVQIGTNDYDEPVTSLVLETHEAEPTDALGDVSEEDEADTAATPAVPPDEPENDTNVEREALIDTLLSMRVPALHGKHAGWVKAIELAEFNPWLKGFLVTHPKNFARDLRTALFFGQPDVITERGVLRSDTTAKRHGLLLKFEPRTG